MAGPSIAKGLALWLLVFLAAFLLAPSEGALILLFLGIAIGADIQEWRTVAT